MTFAQFVEDVASRGEVVNTMFEERLFDLVAVLHKIGDALTEDGIPHELIGGLAVLIHVEEADSTHARLTRDVDMMVRRSDLERIKGAAAKHGFRYRHAAGVDMLLYGTGESANKAVHLVFSGEKVRPNYPAPTPPIDPERKQVHGHEVCVISVADLVTMKLTSFRLKDQVHVKDMDAAGLLTAKVEATLSPELRARLEQIRSTE